jgi:hypothetical protein
MKDLDRAIKAALVCSEAELKIFAHHSSMKVISNLLYNSNLTEPLALIVAGRKNVSPEILESLYSNKKWRESYRIRLALCKNPKTPQTIVLSNVKSLRIFDLADLTRNQHVPMNVRIAAETHISEKILSLPLGIKITLARRASSNVLIRLLEDGMREVVSVCLDSPYMTEGIMCKIINTKKIASHVIRQIAGHPKWSCRHDVQFSLIRNNSAPLSRVVHFLKNMKTTELKELYEDPVVPKSTRPFIYRERMDRIGGDMSVIH